MLQCCVRLLSVIVCASVRPRAKVTIDNLQKVAYEKSIGTEMNDLDVCLEVLSRSRQPVRHIRY